MIHEPLDSIRVHGLGGSCATISKVAVLSKRNHLVTRCSVFVVLNDEVTFEVA